MLRALLEQVTLLLRCALFAQCALLVLPPIPPLPLQRGYSFYVSYYFSDLSSYPLLLLLILLLLLPLKVLLLTLLLLLVLVTLLLQQQPQQQERRQHQQ